MYRFIGRRLLQAVFVIWAAYTLTFAILFLLPGDPVSIMLSGSSDSGVLNVDPAVVEELRAQYGFDKPPLVMYLSYLTAALKGDFGRSVQNGALVLDRIVENLAPTLMLGGMTIVFSVVLGLVIASAAMYTKHGWLRRGLLALPAIGIAMPGFWVGIILIQIFSFQFGWFPAGGNGGFSSLVLPALTISVSIGAILAQVFAQSLGMTLDEAYAGVLRSRGASRARIFGAHALRNAALPTMTLVGMMIGQLISGTAVIETVFSRSGVGRLGVAAVGAQDLPLVLGIVTMGAIATVTATLLVDIAYVVVDPRTRTKLIKS